MVSSAECRTLQSHWLVTLENAARFIVIELQGTKRLSFGSSKPIPCYQKQFNSITAFKNSLGDIWTSLFPLPFWNAVPKWHIFQSPICCTCFTLNSSFLNILGQNHLSCADEFPFVPFSLKISIFICYQIKISQLWLGINWSSIVYKRVTDELPSEWKKEYLGVGILSFRGILKLNYI